MNASPAASLFVVTPEQGHLQQLQERMTADGLTLECHWAADAESLPDERLPDPPPALLFVFDAAQLAATAAWRDRHAPTARLLLVNETLTDAAVDQALAQGAADVVALTARRRTRQVVERELRLATLDTLLAEANSQLTAYREQLTRITSESTRAFLWVQEGIVADANLACVTLLGLEDVSELVALPAMDVFAAESRAALKGALVACERGSWKDDLLRCRLHDGTEGRKGDAVDVLLEADLYDGDAAIRLELTPTRREDVTAAAGSPPPAEADEAPPGVPDEQAPPAPAVAPAAAVAAGSSRSGDPFAPFYQRRNFLHAVADGLERSQAGGLRVLYHVRLDKMNTLVERWGPLGLEEILRGLAETIADSVHPGDLWGQLAAGNFCVLADRGTQRDIDAWGEQLLRRVTELSFLLSGEDVKVRACVGAAVKGRSDDLSSLASKAARASRRAQESGEQTVVVHDAESVSLEQTADDRANLKRIKHALINDGFRLAYQPIADLLERGDEMYDVLLRLVDSDGNETLPGQFLPAAERNGMMKAIDRWVMARVVRHSRPKERSKVFVRVSRDSMPDASLVDWLGPVLSKSEMAPGRLVLQVSESNAMDNLGAAGQLARAARAAGCGFCIEHFGLGAEPRLLFETLPIDYVKIDGSLMQGFPSSADLQDHVRALVDEAKSRDIVCIAERVEDANTMAALWSIGVEYIQGYFVQGHHVEGDDPPAAHGDTFGSTGTLGR